jgi:hypothetical protein
VEEAREANILYRDQAYVTGSGRLYPEDIHVVHTFHDDLTVRFRAIKPSYVDEMRRLFYRFSDQAVYYRYFSRIKTMPHMKMQAYVNVDYEKTMSVIGTIEESGMERIIAEGRTSGWKVPATPTRPSSSTRSTRGSASPPFCSASSSTSPGNETSGDSGRTSSRTTRPC